MFPSESVEPAPLNIMLSPIFAVLGVTDIYATGGASAGVGSGVDIEAGVASDEGTVVSSSSQPLIIMAANTSNPTVNRHIVFCFTTLALFMQRMFMRIL